MNRSSHQVQLVVIAALIFLTPCLWAQDGVKGALSQAELLEPFGRTLAVADIDGDEKPDGALLLGYGRLLSGNFEIQLHFSDRPDTKLTFESVEQALSVTAWDIDHDGDIDLVVEESFTHKPLRVWINEGHGDFHEQRVQDFPSDTLRIHENLQSPPRLADGLVVCLPSQRGLKIAILTVLQLGRPPSRPTNQVVSPDSSFSSQTHPPNSSRAPPLS